MVEWLLFSALGVAGFVAALVWPVWALISIVALQLMPDLGIVEQLTGLHLVAVYGVIVAVRLIVKPPPGALAPSSLRWMIAAFTALAVLSLSWASNSVNAINGLGNEGKAMVFALLVSLFIKRRSELVGLLYIAVVIGVVGALITLYGVAVLGLKEGGSGLQNNPNGNAFLFIVILPLAYSLTRGAQGRTLRVALMIVPALLTVAIIATGSRSAIIATFILWLLLLLRDGKNLTVYVTVFLGALGIALAAPFLERNVEHFAKLRQLGEEKIEEGSLAGRKALVVHGLAAFFDSPAVGYGLRNGRLRVAEHMYGQKLGTVDPEWLSSRGIRGDLHNTYLTVAVDFGVLGLGLFLAIAAMAIRAGRNLRRHETVAADPYLSALARYLPAGLVAMLILVLFMTQLLSPLFWTMLLLPSIVGNVAANAVAERTVVEPSIPRSPGLAHLPG